MPEDLLMAKSRCSAGVIAGRRFGFSLALPLLPGQQNGSLICSWISLPRMFGISAESPAAQGKTDYCGISH